MSKIYALTAILVLLFTFPLYADYDSKAPLNVTKTEFCVDKPKGLGQFELRENNEFGEHDKEAHIYIEVSNCKTEKEDRYYHLRLSMDVDIYYEDGVLIFSQEDVNVFDRQSIRKASDAYLWARIDLSQLKEGEYKVEMTIKDLNSEKESFALRRFKKI